MAILGGPGTTLKAKFATPANISPIATIVVGAGLVFLGGTMFGPAVALSLVAVIVYWVVR